MDVLVEELVDKEVAKVVEQVNRKFTAVGQQKLGWGWQGGDQGQEVGQGGQQKLG